MLDGMVKGFLHGEDEGVAKFLADWEFFVNGVGIDAAAKFGIAAEFAGSAAEEANE